jgi:hypothetical protein
MMPKRIFINSLLLLLLWSSKPMLLCQVAVACLYGIAWKLGLGSWVVDLGTAEVYGIEITTVTTLLFCDMALQISYPFTTKITFVNFSTMHEGT